MGVFDSKALSLKIAQCRIKAELKPKELASLCGLTAGHINNLERGKGIVPTIDNLQNIADALNVSLDELLEDNLTVFKKFTPTTNLEKEILNTFYLLSDSKKQSVLNIIGSLEFYKDASADESLNSKELEWKEKILGSASIQEIIVKLSSLTDEQQKFVLDLITPAVLNIDKVNKR